MSDRKRVLITTSGMGSRLGRLTDFTNKSLVTIGGKPALARIIEQYPIDTTFVITLGHFGDHVRQFLELAYPEAAFEFVEVEKYYGPGSSLAVSMLHAKDLLQQSFIFNASDSLVLSPLSSFPSGNWIGGYLGLDGANYATFDTFSDQVSQVYDKGMVNFDYIHTGIVGIEDFNSFWKNLEEVIDEEDYADSLNDLSAVKRMINQGVTFSINLLDSWIDIGNSRSLQQAEDILGNPHDVLRKSDESISFVESRVIKFFNNSEKCSQRVKRAGKLGDLVPEIDNATRNFYSYGYVPGIKLSKVYDPNVIRELLDWSSKKLWTSEELEPDNHFNSACEQFYRIKTKSRLESFFTSRRIQDDSYSVINGQQIPPLFDFLDQAIDFCLLDCKQVRIHGDFILDNIISINSDFKLIDWREDFAGLIDTGDKYYDLSKLNHSLVISHELINRGLFDLRVSDDDVTCNVLVNDYTMIMRDYFQSWVSSQGLNQKKISILTSIIWLNMSPLHHHPFDQFLYYYGKLNMWRALNEA